jgi:hypothetical protein
VALLSDAADFTAGSPLAKIRRDLKGVLYADGIHDSLYRAAGRILAGIPALAVLRSGASHPLPHMSAERNNLTHA